MTAQASAAIDGAAPPMPVPRGLLAVLSANMLIDALEVSAAMVALPSIGHDLHLSHVMAQWVVGGFALGFGGLLFAGRRITGWHGERRTYLAALLLFAVASAVGALAASITVLIATRVIKGACAALTAPTGLAIIGRTFPEGAARNRAIAIYSAFGSSGFLAGLLISGLITQVSWRWTFLFPAPVALVLFLLGTRLVPAGAGAAVSADAVGRGVPVSLRSLLVSRQLWRTALGAAALNGSLWGLLFMCTFRLQGALGWTPLQTGAALLPAALPAAITAPLSRRLVGRFDTNRLIVVGAVMPPIGSALYWLSSGGQPFSLGGYAADVLPGLLLFGTGLALCFAALHVQALAGLRPAQYGMATALYQTAVQLGGVLVLVLVTIPAGLPGPAIVTVVSLLGFLVALYGVTLRGRSA
jgi:MFS family permease